MHLLYYLPVSLFSLSIFHFFSLARILKWLLPSNDVTYKRFYCCDLSSNIIIILHISFKGERLVLLLFFLVILISYFKNPCVCHRRRCRENRFLSKYILLISISLSQCNTQCCKEIITFVE